MTRTKPVERQPRRTTPKLVPKKNGVTNGKRSVGRPSKYKPEYCEMLIKHMKNGGSFTTFAAIVEVNADTLHEWVKVHEDFSETKKVAVRLAEKWWEDASKAGMMGQVTRVKERQYDENGNVTKEIREPAHFNATVWVFTMKNRFNWRDKRELTGKDGGPIELQSISDEELDARLNALEASNGKVS